MAKTKSGRTWDPKSTEKSWHGEFFLYKKREEQTEIQGQKEPDETVRTRMKGVDNLDYQCDFSLGTDYDDDKYMKRPVKKIKEIKVIRTAKRTSSNSSSSSSSSGVHSRFYSQDHSNSSWSSSGYSSTQSPIEISIGDISLGGEDEEEEEEEEEQRSVSPRKRNYSDNEETDAEEEDAEMMEATSTADDF
jgi:hypothetical protein